MIRKMQPRKMMMSFISKALKNAVYNNTRNSCIDCIDEGYYSRQAQDSGN